MPDPINPWFLRIYCDARFETKEGEALPPNPVQHTQASLNRTDLATDLVADNTWTSTSGIISQKTTPTRHHHITE
jgi:hypothetical protein